MKTLKLYAVCWQDNSQPWGWEPCEPLATAHGETVSPFSWSYEEAEHLRTVYEAPPRVVWCSYSVQEYEVPAR